MTMHLTIETPYFKHCIYLQKKYSSLYCTKTFSPLIIYIFILKPNCTTLRCFSRCVYLFPSLLEISTVVDGKRLPSCIILLEVQAHVCFSKSLFLEVPFCFKLSRSKYKIQRRCYIQIFYTFPPNHPVKF